MTDKTNSTQKKNRFSIRVLDTSLIDLIEDLTRYHENESTNSILNTALKIGIYSLYDENFGTNKTQEDQEINLNDDPKNKQFKVLKSMINQNAISIKICEKLLTAIFNFEYLKADEEVGKLWNKGMLDQLPEIFESVKLSMIRSEYRRGKY
jgi:hypothetical protein